MANEDLFSDSEESILGRISNRLRVLLDLRHRLKNDKDSKNIVDLKTRATQRRLGHLIDKYKRLLRPSRRYFHQRGMDLTIHEYQEYDSRLKKIAEAINKEKDEDEGGKGGSKVKPRTNVIEIGAQNKEQTAGMGEPQQTATSMDRIQKFLDQCEIDFQDLPVELQLAAIEYLMKQNEAEFMTFINFIYMNLSDLKDKIQRRQGNRETTQAQKNLQQQEQGVEMASMEEGLEQGMEVLHEGRNQPNEEPKKKLAFSKQLDKIDALMAKIGMAMGKQPTFNPKPYM